MSLNAKQAGITLDNSPPPPLHPLGELCNDTTRHLVKASVMFQVVSLTLALGAFAMTVTTRGATPFVFLLIALAMGREYFAGELDMLIPPSAAKAG